MPSLLLQKGKTIKKSNCKILVYMGKVLVFFSFFILLVGNSYLQNRILFNIREMKKVNLRQGPSLDHPIKLIYKKKIFTCFNT